MRGRLARALIAGVAATLGAAIAMPGVAGASSPASAKAPDAAALYMSTNVIPTVDVKLGATVKVATGFGNLGTASTPSVLVIYALDYGLVPVTYDNCLYAQRDSTEISYVACTIAGPLGVDQDATVAGGFPVTVASDAAPHLSAGVTVSATDATTPVTPTDPTFGGYTFVARPVSGHKLGLAFAADPAVSSANGSRGGTAFAVDTTSDLVVKGGSLTGAVGSTITVPLGYTVAGPGSYLRDDNRGFVPQFHVTVPSWALVTKASDDCVGANIDYQWPLSQATGQNGAKFYECTPPGELSLLPAGGGFTLLFTFQITSTTGVDGAVSINTQGADLDLAKIDTNTGNDDGVITLVGGHTTPLPPEGSHPSPSPSHTAVAGGPVGSLPATGNHAGIIVGTGLALIIVGGVLLLGSRRRNRSAPDPVSTDPAGTDQERRGQDRPIRSRLRSAVHGSVRPNVSVPAVSSWIRARPALNASANGPSGIASQAARVRLHQTPSHHA